jgi:pyruvate-formate lyase-activating enzyme
VIGERYTPFDQTSKALVHVDRLRRIARGDVPPPVSVKLELTNVCNHDCHFCAYRRIVQDPAIRDMLPTQIALDLVDDLAAGGVHGLMLTGGGEPLVHPGVADVIARCGERGLQVGLITNGTRLGRLSDATLSMLRWIRFSINAGDAATYASVHGTNAGAWAEVWAQVGRAANLAIDVGVSIVVTARNYRGVVDLVRRAREHGARYAHVRPAFEGPHTQLERQLSGDEIDACLTAVEHAALEWDEGIPTPSGRGADFQVALVHRRFDEVANPSVRHIHCRATPLVAYVLPTGEVSICTMVRAPSFNPRVVDPFLGSLHTQRFFDVWATPRHRELIAALSTSGCKRCHFAEYNRALELVADDRLHAAFL